MKNILITLSLITALNGYAQVQAITDSLSAEYRVAQQISDDPTLNLKRVVSLNYITWYSKGHHAIVQFDVHYLLADGSYFQSKVLQNPQKISFPLNRDMLVDSLGNDITHAQADTLQNTSNEYDFLLDLLDNGYNYIDLIEAKILELDSEAKFD